MIVFHGRDIAPTDVALGEVPVPPAGYEIVRVDVVVRLLVVGSEIQSP